MRAAMLSDERTALGAAWQLQRSGNFVAAFDLAQEGLSRWPGSLPLQHLSVLALASCGSTSAALSAFRTTDLAASANEDYLALEARLLKDLAFGAAEPTRAGLLVEAAQAYERIAERTHGSYTAQNAALLWTLAGNEPRAARLASDVIAGLSRTRIPPDEEAAYFHWATLAEAALVLGDGAVLAEAVARANGLCRRNVWARTRTFAQMRLLCDLRPACAPLVQGWYRPAVGFVSGRLDEPGSDSAGADPDGFDGVDDLPALAYAAAGGALGGGGASAGGAGEGDWFGLAAQGVQLHVILADAPADAEAAPGQFAAARAASGHRGSHTWSSLLLDDGEDRERACVETALGLSVGSADALHSPWVVLRRSGGVWRAYAPRDGAGLDGMKRPGAADAAWFAPELKPLAVQSRSPRRYGFLFADAVGYSTLSAAETRRYWEKLLPETGAAVLRRHAGDLLFRKTWGDAVHGVFRTASAAAAAALEMTAATARLAEELALGRRLAFRVAVHYGTADAGVDPVEEVSCYFGPQLSFAARIVPVAPPGGVFVTEPLAAQLSLEGAAGMTCTYVGATSLAKGYGRVRLLGLATRS
jgi:class 3 adenylate cyclase